MSGRLEAALAELAEALRAELAEAAAASARPAPERLLSLEEAAEALGISRTSVYAELRAGRLRTLKIGKRRLVPSSALGEYAAARR